MKALSIKQPWAWLIVNGYKDIENRNWRIGRKPGLDGVRGLELPSRIYVHAGKEGDFSHENQQFISKCLVTQGHKIITTHDFFPDKFGAIIGEVDIIGCVTESVSPWFVGPYGFVLANPEAYDKPIPMRGRLGFWDVNLQEGVQNER